MSRCCTRPQYFTVVLCDISKGKTDVLSGKPKETDHLIFLRISWENMDWIPLAQRIDHWIAIMDIATGLWGFINGNFLVLTNYDLVFQERPCSI
jgi:hypothetical protein